MTIGEHAVGKTNLLKVYHGQGFSQETFATVGIDYVTKEQAPT